MKLMLLNLEERVALVHSQIAQACERVSRPQGEVTLIAVRTTHSGERVREMLRAGWGYSWGK